MKIYLAGPLFTLAERQFNLQMAGGLRAHGHEVWVPQENEPPHKDADMGLKIFQKDVEGLEFADIIVACMDGPDPDSGTCWECGWAYAKNKPVITFRTDFRADGDVPGAPFNLMLVHSSVMLFMPWVDLYEIVETVHAEILKIRANTTSRI